MKFKSLILPVLAAVVAASVAANAALWQWSKTAANNATADPSINFSEGMSPSAVNDSARALMARVAEWRDDISGLLVPTGTGGAYTLVTNQGLDATPTNGQMISFTPHLVNTIAPTLRVDGGNIYPIQSSPGAAVGAGVLLADTPYTVKFKSSTSSWILHSFFGQPFVVPIGGMIDYLGTTSPNSNFVLPVGQCISRTTYSTFFALVSTRYGVCDGSTTFAVPDFRGTIAAAQDNMGGTTRGLITNAGSGCVGTTMGAQCGAQNVVIGLSNLPSTTLSGTTSGSLSVSTSGTLSVAASGTLAVTTSGSLSVSTSGTSTGTTSGTLSGSGSISGNTVDVEGNIQIPNFGNIVVAAGSGQSVSEFAGNSSSQPVSIEQGTLSGTASITTSGSLSVSTTGTATGSTSGSLGGTATGSVSGSTSGGMTGTATGSLGVSAPLGGSDVALRILPPIQITTKLLRIF